MLWFAEKFVSLLIEQHHRSLRIRCNSVVICWKIRIFAYWTTPSLKRNTSHWLLWFAEKFVSLLIEQHHVRKNLFTVIVVICWKIRIFAYWTTPFVVNWCLRKVLWFAEKFVSLLIEQHLCRILPWRQYVVICWKIRIFAYWTTPTRPRKRVWTALWFAEKFVSLLIEQHRVSVWNVFGLCCDLLKNSYLCLLNNTCKMTWRRTLRVVICWKIRIFAYWTTPPSWLHPCTCTLWFAEKFVSLLIEQHLFLPWW